jgi:hypothetical protein
MVQAHTLHRLMSLKKIIEYSGESVPLSIVDYLFHLLEKANRM